MATGMSSSPQSRSQQWCRWARRVQTDPSPAAAVAVAVPVNLPVDLPTMLRELEDAYIKRGADADAVQQEGSRQAARAWAARRWSRSSGAATWPLARPDRPFRPRKRLRCRQPWYIGRVWSQRRNPVGLGRAPGGARARGALRGSGAHRRRPAAVARASAGRTVTRPCRPPATARSCPRCWPIGSCPSTRTAACCARRPACRCDEIYRLFLPRGWFVPVTPGTKFVTLGGMVAADVHGKNHHKDGLLRRARRWTSSCASPTDAS